MIQRNPMTEKGAKKLREILHQLKTHTRSEIIKAIKEARAHGDLKENSEYHAAKEEQGFIERRIIDIETKLMHNQVIDPSKMTNQDKVVFGGTIHLINTENDEKVIYQIVGEDEADIKTGTISFNSPIARALIGKTLGDRVEVKTPTGLQFFEIDKIEYI